MNCVAAGFGYQVAGLPSAWMCSVPAFGFFIVDRAGRRYLNEPSVEHHAANHALAVREFRTGEFPRLPSYPDLRRDHPDWPDPSSAVEAGQNRRSCGARTTASEIDRGWIKQGDTLDDAGQRARDLPPMHSPETGKRFDEAARTPAATSSDVPPKPWCRASHPRSTGSRCGRRSSTRRVGPGATTRGEVIAVDGEPIPGLLQRGRARLDVGGALPGRRQRHRGARLRPHRWPLGCRGGMSERVFERANQHFGLHAHWCPVRLIKSNSCLSHEWMVHQGASESSSERISITVFTLTGAPCV